MGDNVLTRIKPRLSFNNPPATGSSSPPEAPPADPRPPVAQQPLEAQVEFHESKARRLEDRLKAFGGLTPDQVRDLQAERDQLLAGTKTAEEQALSAAEERGRAEGRSELARERVKHALERALDGRIVDPGALLEIDRQRFVNGAEADPDRIAAWVEQHSTAAATAPKPPSLFQGPRDPITVSDRETGRAEAAKRYRTTPRKDSHV